MAKCADDLKKKKALKKKKRRKSFVKEREFQAKEEDYYIKDVTETIIGIENWKPSMNMKNSSM